MNPIKTYFMYIRIFFKARSEYKVSFITGIFSNFYSYLISFFSFWVIVNRFENIDGWKFEDVSMLYGLNLFSYAAAGVLVWYSIYHLEHEITSGRLDLYLTRPMNVLGQLICSRFGETFLGQIIVSGLFLVNTLKFYKESLSLGLIIYFIFALIGSVALQTGAMIIIGSLSFWTMRSMQIGSVFYYQLRNLTHYPLSIYPGWIKAMLTFIVPWAFINYYPSLIILQKSNSLFDQAMGYLAPLIGVLVLGIAVVVFNKGIENYTSSGS